MGTRLLPLTKVTNKCLLPIYNTPMIYWPLQTLVESGVKDILLVCGGNSASEFLRILGDGSDLGIKSLYYAFQKEFQLDALPFFWITKKQDQNRNYIYKIS